MDIKLLAGTCRWDEYLLRPRDSFWEAASERAAKLALSRREPQQDADAAGVALLPLQLRPAAREGTQGRGQEGLRQGEALAALRRVAQGRAGQGAGSLGQQQTPWANFNDSELVPLIPNEVRTAGWEARPFASAPGTARIY